MGVGACDLEQLLDRPPPGYQVERAPVLPAVGEQLKQQPQARRIKEIELSQIDDESQIAGLVADVLARHGDAVAQYRGGKATTFGFLVGQVMKAAAGKANPRRVNELLKRALDA
jgi:Asp-tRNA(Asn)/Glu-tRNA(Gln) amidotransferase B subunit